MLAIEWLETVRRRAADALAARSAKRRRLEAARQSLGDFLPHGHQAESLEQRLMLSDTATALIFAQPPAGALAGSTLPSIAVDVVDSSSQIVATDTSTITLALSAGTFNGGSNVVTANAVNGIATFASVAIAAAGSYTLAATDGMLTPAVSGSFNVYRFNPIASLLPPPNGANPYGDVVLDSNGNLFGTSNQGGTSNLGTVFEIVHGSSAIIAIASFNGANGSHPEAGLAIDTSGNFFGTTYQGGASGYGTVFEIAHGTTTVTTIAAFNGIDGANPTAAVTLDSGGDIFGTTPSHGANGFGTVFEIVRGATTLTTVASFTTLSGGVPEAPVILDSNGNLFGTTSSYGPSGLGTVFEIASGSDAITLTAAFTGSTGHNPYGAVTFDSSGNLFGTTNQGGTSNNGTVFEVAHGSSIVTTTARFVRNTSGALPYGGLTIDTSGNLFGTTSVGGTGGLGTVFEIAHGTTALIAIGSFSNGTGTNPQGGVTLDSSGNLFGAAQFGGTNSDGTVFEIAHGTTVINALASFTNPSAENPIAALAVDSSGDVFGATPSGGVNNDGSVFEIPNGSTNVTVIASFNGNNGNSPYGGVTLDSSGNIFGTTQSGGISGAGTVFEIVHGTNVINAIASFNTAGGYLSYGGISLDSSGDLFGATFLGGANSDGVVFEIVHGTSVITTVASFNGANGRNPLGGVTLDSSGDIFGTTEGATSMGTVFEIAHNTTTISTIASFNSTTGIDPDGGIALDSAGDLFGTTFSDGSGSYGTVFEIPHGTTAISTLASFNYDNGGYLYANVTLDSSGNIFGAAAVGGAAGDGLIFEIPFGTSAIETLLSFNGANGANPHATLTLDSSGNLFGDTQNGGANNTGAVFDLSIAPPPTLSFTMPPISTTAGGVLGGSNGVQVSVLLAGSVVTADSTTVILTLSGAVFSTGSNTASAAVVNGVATFNNLIIDASGNCTLTASDGIDTPATSPSFTVAPGPTKTLVFATQPINIATGNAFSPAVAVSLEDGWGNIATADSSTVTLTLNTGNFSSGGNTITASAVNGVATFGNLAIAVPGAYTLAATDGMIALVSSIPFTVYQFVQIASFAPGIYGSQPDPASTVAIDSSGNIFGTEKQGGNAQDGAVFEIVHGTTDITNLASFNYSTGSYPQGVVVLDSSGNLFGTTESGGASGAGTVFEVARGTNSILTVASFSYGNAPGLYAGIALDSSGDIFGTTISGGSNSEGGVFEIVPGTASAVSLASFNFINGANPYDGVTLDSSGDLFGTTSGGGLYNAGEVFEIPAGSTTINIVCSFTGANGTSYPQTGVTLDTAGNIYGTTSANDGAVFEIVHGTSTAITPGTFNGANGNEPLGNLALDSSGNLFGVTEQGGSANDGVIFEIPHGTNAIQPVISFTAPGGAFPMAGLTLDSSGILYGTTLYGGNIFPYFNGTVFEIRPTPLLALSFIVPPISTNSGAAINGSTGVQVSVTVSGNVVTTDSSAITLTLNGGLFSTGYNTVTASAVNGVATFNSLTINGVGSYTLTASYGIDTPCTSSSFTINPGPVTHIGFPAPPATTMVGANFNPAVTAALEDALGNIVATAPTTITLTLSSGTFTTGANTVTATTVNGAATFNNLAIGAAGTYSVTASASGYSAVVSSSFNVDLFNAFASVIPPLNGTDPVSTLVMDSSGNLFGTTQGGGTSNAGTIFEIAGGTSNLTTIASFNRQDGANPRAGLILDGSGDLFGTTSAGGANNDGTAFEIIQGTNVITTIAAFNSATGFYPVGPVVMDTSGDLFGTTVNGGANNLGTVFEIAQGSSLITPLAAFNYSNSYPQSGVTIDSSGDLFGTTYSGGSNSYGSVFEVVHGSSVISTIASFNSAVSARPYAIPTLDSNGDLFGTTESGGGGGTVFEIVHGTTAITILATFNNPTGEIPIGGVTLDTAGDLFGVNSQGGSGSDGTVFEIVHGTTTATVVASFNNANGEFPDSSVIVDSSGDIFGTTPQGGAGFGGTVFEIVHGASAITTVAAFDVTANAPGSALIPDSSGNLFGTTSAGGTSNYGTVFEIAHGTTTVTTLASFNVATGIYPEGSLTLDTSGNLFGTTSFDGPSGGGTVFEIVHGTSAISTVASFNSLTGDGSYAALTLDSSGDLFGTCEAGGPDFDGGVFEIVHGTSVVTPIAWFNGNNGNQPAAAVTLDSSGDIFGTTQDGGSNGDGTVFEIVHGASVITSIASFNGVNGADIQDAVVLDSNGNIFGAVIDSGYSGQGTFFEIHSGSSVITILASFNNVTGDLPLDLIVDSTGNLFGITGAGGPGGYGTVFEIVSGTTAICNLMSFNFTNGARPTGGLSLDANGDFFGSTGGGGAFDAGEFFELTPIPSALSFTTPPVSTTVGGSLGAGAGVQASLLYSWGNPVSTDSSNITLTLSGGIFSTGSNTATIAAVSGIATFANLAIDVVGTYTLTATDGAIAPATSAPFTIAAAPNSVAGEVFNDANNNGALDSGEVGQATVNVTLTPTGATIGAPMTIATTGDGYYIFQNVSAGTYSVSESPPNGCALTAPIGGSAAVTVTAGQSSSGPTFGNVLISSVTLNFNTLVALSQDYDKPGTFANSDLNGDGMVDFSDLVLLSQNYNATLPSGSYTFTGASTLASSSAQTTTPAAPSPVAKTKAVTATASISGTVFNDVNGNSSRQSSEEGLSGRKVDLEIAGKGSVGQRTAITDSKGNFSFTNLPAGGYILIIPAPAGWRSTTAIASGDRLTLTSGEKTTSLRFGQQIIPPFTVTSTRVTDPLDHTKDLVTFYVRNNGVGATAGTRNLLAIDATLSSPGGLLIRTDDADGSGLLDDADFAGENTTPTASYIRIGGLAFVVASTTPAAKSDRYRDMQVVPSFEVAGILLGGVAANGASGTRIAAAIVTKGKAVTIVGRLGAEKGTLVPFSFTG